MWILDKRGGAVKTDCLQRLFWENVKGDSCTVIAQTKDENVFLGDFATRDDAKAYIADLVSKLNGDTPDPDLRAITSLNDLSHIRDELNIIFDSLYPPENRDAALTHTKELIEYVDLLIAEIGDDNHNV